MRALKCVAITTVSLCVGLFILLVIILIPVSIKVIEQDEYGIRYDNYSKEIYPTIYEQGRYLFNIFDNVIIYKRNFIRIEQLDENRLPCLSKDGLPIDIDFTTQYQFKKSELTKVMLEYGTSEQVDILYRSIARSSIRDACGNYSAENFFFERGKIETSALEFMKEDFKDTESHVNIGFLQLTNTKLPQGFIDVIQEKQLATQDVDKALNERTEILIKADTDLKTAEQEANIILINAQANATSVLNNANKTAQIIETKWNQRAIAFLNIKNSLGLTEAEFVRNYLKSYVLQSSHTPTVGL